MFNQCLVAFELKNNKAEIGEKKLEMHFLENGDFYFSL